MKPGTKGDDTLSRQHVPWTRADSSRGGARQWSGLSRQAAADDGAWGTSTFQERIGESMSKTAQQREKIRNTEKETIVLTVIEPRIMSFGKCVSKNRKGRLMAMSKIELQKLAQDLQGVRTLQEAVTMTVNAWTDSEHARGVADWDAPANGPVKP